MCLQRQNGYTVYNEGQEYKTEYYCSMKFHSQVKSILIMLKIYLNYI